VSQKTYYQVYTHNTVVTLVLYTTIETSRRMRVANDYSNNNALFSTALKYNIIILFILYDFRTRTLQLQLLARLLFCPRTLHSVVLLRPLYTVCFPSKVTRHPVTSDCYGVFGTSYVDTNFLMIFKLL